MYSVCAKNIFRNQPECEAEGHFRGIFSDLTKVQNANIMEYFTSLVQFSLEFSRMGLWLKGFLQDYPTAVALSSPSPCTYTNTNLHCRQCEKHVYVMYKCACTHVFNNKNLHRNKFYMGWRQVFTTSSSLPKYINNINHITQNIHINFNKKKRSKTELCQISLY